MEIGVFASGFKGLKFLEHIYLNLYTNSIKFVCSSESVGSRSSFYKEIQSVCSSYKYTFYDRKDLTDSILAKVEIIFVVGWQYIIKNTDDRYIIFHDSILPRYRGFAPTVTALINGDHQIGVTALKASNLADKGNIYEQRVIEIRYPIKIQDVYILLAKSYVELAISILEKRNKKTLVATPQLEANATYSIWRDEEDYFINWNWEASKILRFIDAVSYPYKGAKTIYQSKVIYISDASIMKDLFFEDRHSGKIWSISQGCPEVICGTGMLKITFARDENDEPVKFDKIRSRLKSNFIN